MIKKKGFSLNILKYLLRYLSVLIILIFSFPADAQLQVGVRAGMGVSRINLADLIVNTNIEQGIHQGIRGGLVVKYISSSHVGFQIELNYAEKGWIQKVDKINPFQTNLNYVEMPFMSHFYFGKGSFRPFLNAGLYVGRLIAANDKNYTESTTGERVFRYDADIDHLWEYGLTGGAGFMIKTGVGIFQLEANVSQGLSSILKIVGDDLDGDISNDTPRTSQNQMFSGSLIYLVQFGKDKIKKD